MIILDRNSKIRTFKQNKQENRFCGEKTLTLFKKKQTEVTYKAWEKKQKHPLERLMFSTFRFTDNSVKARIQTLSDKGFIK